MASAAQMGNVLDRIAEHVTGHRTTIVFVNTRRLAERLAHELGERLGDDVVAAHHGSLSKDRRLRVETRLRAGELKALVATASLELGIDIGPVELVCQIGSPRSIATFLQRVGRSNHTRTGTPRGRLYPLTRDELVECTGLLAAVRAGRLDAVEVPVAPLDILAQQIIAETAAEEWKVDDLYALVTTAHPYRVAHPGGVRRGAGPRQQRDRDRPGHPSRLRPPRPGQRRAAGPQGRPARRPHQRWRHPRARRLPRHRRARRDADRQRQRGLGHGVDGRRRVHPRDAPLADPAGHRRRGPGGRRRRQAPDDPVLARRGPRPHGGAERGGRPHPVGGGAGSGRRRPGPSGRRDRRAGRGRARRRRHHRHLPGGGSGRARRHAHPGRPGHRAVLRRVGRDAARGPLALRRPAQPGDGVRAAQEVLRRVQLRAPGERQRRCRSSSPSGPTTASRSPTCPASSPRARSGPRCSRPSSTSRSSRAAGGGTSTGASSCCASAAGARCRRRSSGCRATTCSPSCSPAPPPARRTSPGPIEVPDTPLPRQAVHDCLTEALDCDGLIELWRAGRGGRGALPLRRLHRAVAARPRDPQRRAVRVPRRR